MVGGEMNYYLVEFQSDSVHTQYEEVSAISAQEAVNSIKNGWPEAKIYNVWTEVGENDLWI
jgi:hypothetical protein